MYHYPGLNLPANGSIERNSRFRTSWDIILLLETSSIAP